MCVKLSDFLRISLRLGERASITFGEEWELARTYLDVEQVRFGTRLRVVEQIDAGCADCEVPPLLVQPLVENAIKHGIATLVEGGEIAITAARVRDGLNVVIENGFDPDAPRAKKSGIGIRNVRDRLTARYGSAGRLEISVAENRYRAAISLPCDSSGRSV
jgi:LytS/YehU family sensor histidine kinase